MLDSILYSSLYKVQTGKQKPADCTMVDTSQYKVSLLAFNFSLSPMQTLCNLTQFQVTQFKEKMYTETESITFLNANQIFPYGIESAMR